MQPVVHETRRMRPLLGTFVEISASGNDAPTLSAIDAAFAAIADVHACLSFQQGDSELSQLNAAPGQWVRMSAHSLRVLRLARAMTRASDQLFDCTLGGMLIARGVLPDPAIDSGLDCLSRHCLSQHCLSQHCLPRGCADDIEIAGDRARLKRPVRITLDGIAKGYAVDRAIATLKRHGMAHGWVNAGGDLRVYGERVLPVLQRQLDGTTKALGGLTRAALATSHVVTSYRADMPGFIVRGSDDAKIPSLQPDVFSVIARFAWRADALTKVAALAPPSERARRVAALGGLLIEEAVSCAA